MREDRLKSSWVRSPLGLSTRLVLPDSRVSLKFAALPRLLSQGVSALHRIGQPHQRRNLLEGIPEAKAETFRPPAPGLLMCLGSEIWNILSRAKKAGLGASSVLS